MFWFTTKKRKVHSCVLKDDNYGEITTEAHTDKQYNNMTRDYLQLLYDGIKNQDFKTNKVSIM